MATNDKIRVKIKASIKRLIKEKGLTMAEVAAKMDITGPALSQVINGNPSLLMLERIAGALDVDVRMLFEGTGNELYGMVQYKDRSYKIDSVESIKQLLSDIENG